MADHLNVATAVVIAISKERQLSWLNNSGATNETDITPAITNVEEVMDVCAMATVTAEGQAGLDTGLYL